MDSKVMEVSVSWKIVVQVYPPPPQQSVYSNENYLALADNTGDIILLIYCA